MKALEEKEGRGKLSLIKEMKDEMKCVEEVMRQK